MNDIPQTSNELIANIYELLRKQQSFMCEQGFKVQAMELTLRPFPDVRPVYEASLLQARSPEALKELDLGLRSLDAAIALFRSNQFGSA